MDYMTNVENSNFTSKNNLSMHIIYVADNEKLNNFATSLAQMHVQDREYDSGELS